jgi:hypothetical protein
MTAKRTTPVKRDQEAPVPEAASVTPAGMSVTPSRYLTAGWVCERQAQVPA